MSRAAKRETHHGGSSEAIHAVFKKAASMKSVTHSVTHGLTKVASAPLGNPNERKSRLTSAETDRTTRVTRVLRRNSAALTDTPLVATKFEFAPYDGLTDATLKELPRTDGRLSLVEDDIDTELYEPHGAPPGGVRSTDIAPVLARQPTPTYHPSRVGERTSITKADPGLALPGINEDAETDPLKSMRNFVEQMSTRLTGRAPGWADEKDDMDMGYAQNGSHNDADEAPCPSPAPSPPAPATPRSPRWSGTVTRRPPTPASPAIRGLPLTRRVSIDKSSSMGHTPSRDPSLMPNRAPRSILKTPQYSTSDLLVAAAVSTTTRRTGREHMESMWDSTQGQEVSA